MADEPQRPLTEDERVEIALIMAKLKAFMPIKLAKINRSYDHPAPVKDRTN